MRARTTTAAAALFSLIAGAAQAAPIVFTADALGAGPSMSFPNSAAEALSTAFRPPSPGVNRTIVVMGVEDDQQRGVLAAPPDAGRRQPPVQHHAEGAQIAVLHSPGCFLPPDGLIHVTSDLMPAPRRTRR